MELSAAFEVAAKVLPEGWQVALTAERGAAWVTLTGPDGNTYSIDPEDEPLPNQVRRATDMALNLSVLREITALSTSCVGCKFLYSVGYGYSNYTVETNVVRCALDRNPALADQYVDEPWDWVQDPAKDNWPCTNQQRCQLYAEGEYVWLDPEGVWEQEEFTSDAEQSAAIRVHARKHD